MLGYAATSVGYCHVDEGCKFAIKNMHGNNGIAQAPNGTFYVANALWGGLTILEPQADKSLVITDYVKTGMKESKFSLRQFTYPFARSWNGQPIR